MMSRGTSIEGVYISYHLRGACSMGVRTRRENMDDFCMSTETLLGFELGRVSLPIQPESQDLNPSFLFMVLVS